MTPGINAVKMSKVSYKIHAYVHADSSESYGLEAAEKLGVAQARVFKTLVVSLDNKELVVAVIPVGSMLSMKLLARAAGIKKATMAAREEVERSTGYVLGGVSPLGQKRRLQTYIDNSSMAWSTIYVSAGRRGLEIELNPADLIQLTNAVLGDICQ